MTSTISTEALGGVGTGTAELAGAVVVMGVSGCGKSTVAQAIAGKLTCAYLEGDAFHPPANVAKMSQGIPLQDTDRWPWLDELGTALGAAAREQGSAVAACSALRRTYRDRLTAAAGMPVRLVHLAGAREVLAARMAARTDHFMRQACSIASWRRWNRRNPANWR